MLQRRLQQQLPVPNCGNFQNVANSMENERFSTPKCCKAVEMAASRSNMLQIARKTCRKIGSKKNEMGKKTIPDPIC